MSGGAESTEMDTRGRALGDLVSSASAGVAALALDVISRQGEAHVLFAGRDFADKRAAAHGVEGDDAIVGGTNVVTILERGPSEARDYELLGGLALRGLLAAGLDEDAARRFVGHAEWLDRATPHRILTRVDDVLGDEAGPLWAALGDRIAADDDALDAGSLDAARLAELTYRLKLAAESEHPEARRALGALQSEGARALARALGADLGESAPRGAPVKLRGWLRRRPRARGLSAIVRLVSGWAALSWIARGVGALTGLGRRGELALGADGSELALESELVVLGRALREQDARYPLKQLGGVEVLVRRPGLPLALGAVSLSLGILIGGGWIFDGVRSGETYLLMAGALVVLVGAGIDLALGILLPAGRGRRALRLRLVDGHTLELDRVEEKALAAFLARLETELARR